MVEPAKILLIQLNRFLISLNLKKILFKILLTQTIDIFWKNIQKRLRGSGRQKKIQQNNSH